MLTKHLLPQDHRKVQHHENENPPPSSTDPISIPPPLKIHPTRARRQFEARLAQRQRQRQNQQQENSQTETATTETPSDPFADQDPPSDHANDDSNVTSRIDCFTSDDSIDDSLDSIDSFDGSGAGAAGHEKEEDLGIVLQKRNNQAPGVRFLGLGTVVGREDLEGLGVGVGLGLEDEDLQVERHSSDEEGVIREEEEEEDNGER